MKTNRSTIRLCLVVSAFIALFAPPANAEGRASLLTYYQNTRNRNAWLQLATAIEQSGTSWETHMLASQVAAKGFVAKGLQYEQLAYTRWQAESAAPKKPSDYADIGRTLRQGIEMYQKTLALQAGAAAATVQAPVTGTVCGGCNGTGLCNVCGGSGKNQARTTFENIRAARTFTSGVYYGRRSLGEAATPRSCPTCRGRGRCRHCKGRGVK